MTCINHFFSVLFVFFIIILFYLFLGFNWLLESIISIVLF